MTRRAWTGWKKTTSTRREANTEVRGSRVLQGTRKEPVSALLLQEAPTDQAVREPRERLVDLPTPFKPYAQFPVAVQPRERALDDPAVTPETEARFHSASSNPHLDSTLRECTATRPVVVALGPCRRAPFSDDGEAGPACPGRAVRRRRSSATASYRDGSPRTGVRQIATM